MKKLKNRLKKIAETVFVIAIFSLGICESASGEVKVAIREPLKFKEMRAGTEYGGMILAEGIIEITAEEEDFGKGIKFEMPELSFMNNGKTWIKIEKLAFDKEKDRLEVTKEKSFVRFYGMINRGELEKNDRRELLDGKYEGTVPVVYSVYRKKI